MPVIETNKNETNGAVDYAALNYRWNFGVLTLEAVAFLSCFAFFDPTIILPLLLKNLHASNMQIGFFRVIAVLGYSLPALFSAHYIHGKPRHKRFLVNTCGGARLALLTIPISLVLFARQYPTAVILWLAFVYFIYFTLDGACAVSWYDILGKAIPSRVRGRFFGVMQTLGGAGAMGAGLGTAFILNSHSITYPMNYAMLAAIWCLGAGISQIGLSLIREPEGTVDLEDAKPPITDFLRGAIPMLRSNKQLARIIFTRILIDGAGLAAPFYVLYARRDLHVSLAVCGVYITVQSLGRVVTGPLWGWISDHYGTGAGIRCIAFCAMLIPATAVLTKVFGSPLMPLVFFFMGAVQDGVWMVVSNAMIDAASPEERPLAVGVGSVLLLPGVLYGPLGGLLAQEFPYHIVFITGVCFGAAGILASLTLKTRRASVT